MTEDVTTRMSSHLLSAGDATSASRTKRRRRILYVEQNRDGTIGGSYRSLLFLLKGLDRRIYEPIVAFYRDHELIDDFRAAGCRVILLWYPTSLDLTRPLGRLGLVGRALQPGARLCQKLLNFGWVSTALFVRNLVLLVRQDIDVVHLNNGVSIGAEFLLAAKFLRLKCVVHQRGILGISRSTVRLARRNIDHVICVSDAARQNLIDHGLSPDRCTAIHNGINLSALEGQIQRTPAEVRASLGIAPDAMVVGLAGMIRPWKGQFVLVKAADRLRHAHEHVKVIIMGGVSDQDRRDAAYLEEIRAYIEERDLGSTVMILDHQPNAPEFLQTFDVMVHTAIAAEPFSRVVIEGMALARPIVASATGGTPEAIQDGVSGFLVPPDDPERLAERVDLLLRSPDLRKSFGTAARETVERKFLIQGHIAKTQFVYDNL